MAALGRDLELLARGGDAAARRQDRAGRLDGEAGDDVLAARDAAEYAARLVRQELDLAVAHAHLVAVLLARERGGGEAGADLDALHRVDAHQRAGDIRIELAVEGPREPGGAARGHPRDGGAGRRAGFAPAVEILGPARHHRGVGTPEGVGLDRVPAPVRALDRVRADLDGGAADRDRRSDQL